MRTIREELEAGTVLPRHWHHKAYVTLVTRGEYVEAGDQGRFRVGPGDVLFHDQFGSHANWVAPGTDVTTLNFELERLGEMPALCRSRSFDRVVRLAKSDLPAAIADLLASLSPNEQFSTDWPDLIAKAIRDDPLPTIGHWCRVFDLAPATVSRGFQRSFGVSAAQYRVTARARRAFRLVCEGSMNLAQIALDTGFSDQAHLTRSIHALTGAPPSRWKQVKNLQDGNSGLP